MCVSSLCVFVCMFCLHIFHNVLQFCVCLEYCVYFCSCLCVLFTNLQDSSRFQASSHVFQALGAVKNLEQRLKKFHETGRQEHGRQPEAENKLPGMKGCCSVKVSRCTLPYI